MPVKLVVTRNRFSVRVEVFEDKKDQGGFWLSPIGWQEFKDVLDVGDDDWYGGQHVEIEYVNAPQD